MWKPFFKISKEVVLLVLFLLAFAMIGSHVPSSMEGGHSIFELYALVCYFSKRFRWLFFKIKKMRMRRSIPSPVATLGSH